MTAPEIKHSSRLLLRTIFLEAIVLLPPLLDGIVNTYSSVAIPKMGLSINSLSWFASLTLFTAPLGAISAGIIIDRLGRRCAILFSLLPTTLGWFLLYKNDNEFTLYVGRALTGVMIGCSTYPSQVYIIECVAVNYPELRESFALWASTTVCFGELAVYLLGYFFTYTQLSFIFTVVSLLAFLLVYFYVPESPAWLLYYGKRDEAQIAEQRLGIYQPFLHVHVADDVERIPLMMRRSSGLALLKRKNVYRPTILTTILIILAKFNGGGVLNAYLVDIMNGSSGGSADTAVSYTYSSIGQLLVLAGSLCGSFVIPVTGIRRLTVVAAGGAALGMFLLATAYETPSLQDDASFPLRVVGVWLTKFMINFGVVNIVKLVISEAFPIEAKGFAYIPIVAFSVSGAILLKVHPYLVVQFGGHVFYGYAISILVYGFFVCNFIPETAGKSLAQINQELS